MRSAVLVESTDPSVRRPPENPPRNTALDGLRGIAIAMVVWHHFVELNLPPGRASWLGWLRAGTGLSWTGVDLFFTLSGFLIGGILIDHRILPHFTRVFYLRRATRILPLYFATLAIAALAVVLRLPGSYHMFPFWIYPLFLTNFAVGLTGTWDWLPLSVLWSLAVEEQFYLIAPWVAKAASHEMIPWILAGLALLAEAFRVALMLLYPNGQLMMHVLTPFRMDALVLGVLVAWAVRSKAACAFFDWLGGYWPVLLAGGIAILGGLDLLQPREGSRVMGAFGYLFIASFFALVVAVVARVRPAFLVRCLEARPLVHLGRCSYFIYLWHGLLGQAVIRALGGAEFTLNSLSGVAIVAFAVALTWLLAAVSWRWFERPIVDWGHRYAY